MGLDDWDWERGIQGVVTSEKYYSPPYSLKPSGEGRVDVLTCKAPNTLYIPDGRVEFVFNNNNEEWVHIIGVHFRKDLPLGSTEYLVPRYSVYCYMPDAEIRIEIKEDATL